VKKTRRWPKVLAVLLVLGTPAYWWFFMESGAPEGTYPLDLAELRRLANATEGEKPTELRVEQVAVIEFPKVAVVAGSGWQNAQLPVSSYQAVFPDGGTVIIDTAMNEEGAGGATFDAAAFARVQTAMEKAFAIVVTHEHFDHFAGLVTHPKRESLAAKVTNEQLSDLKKSEPLVVPPDAFTHGQRFTYAQGYALAPGLALWRSAGHTPGSQLVFVQLADGREYLLLGDVAWHVENVERVRERARLVTQFFLGEDRDTVLQQLAAIKTLKDQNPKLNVVPGHDPVLMKTLRETGALVPGFAN
jgi:glyoxylase-like metal-dependent hydrolase (beta-lactamase superfamily II)